MAKQRLNHILNLALLNSNEEQERPDSPQFNKENDITNIILNADVVFSNSYEELDRPSTSHNTPVNETINLDNTLNNEYNLLEYNIESFEKISDLEDTNNMNLKINELVNPYSFDLKNHNSDNIMMVASNESKVIVNAISPEEVDLSDCESVVGNKRKRSTKKEIFKWKREVSKKKRMHGECYMGYSRNGKIVEHNKIRSERTMKPRCSSKKCINSRYCQQFNEEMRSDIFKTYWSATWEEKNTYVTSMVTYTLRKRDTTGLGNESRRSYTFSYFLKHNSSERLQVCKIMFLNTLGLNEWMVQNWTKQATHGLPGKIKKGKIQESCSIVEISPRQKKSLAVRINHLKNWFSTLPKMPSHYCRNKTDRLYLEGPFYCKQEIMDAYKLKCVEDSLVPLSNCYLSNFMVENKLSIYLPRKDKCDFCTSFNIGEVNENDYAEHIAHKDRAREEKEKDTKLAKEKKSCTVLTIDCQAVKLCPVLQTSALYYSMKLKVHNMTIYNNATADCQNYWWHEGNGELEASVFVSIVIKHLEKYCLSEKKPIIIYSDGCGYQNRNVIMANALLHFAVKHEVTIEQKYLVKGHTQMQCDSVHSLIERKLKGQDIHLPSDYIRITKAARKTPSQLGATLLNYDFFLNFKTHQTYASIRPGRTKGDPEVKDIRCLLYNPTTKRIMYKLIFDEPYDDIPVGRKPVLMQNEIKYENLYKKPLSITLSKYQDLQKLKQFLPADTHSFYDSLEHASSFKTKKGKI
ncbi:uncharacterized protein LOC111026860 [Myzus persicae]|uniref:uncharacterized protein LOC111026860 n=1 Tax=Myzus persicae TaxID=13164 RepID=UPI000B930799|nr:uncharacterized protein LOC111026860 [Myzus persicae]